VPIQKCSNKFFNLKYKFIRTYSTSSSNPLNNISHIKLYENSLDMKKDILKDNENKSGIYM
jgi:hypothetical protein